MAVVMSEGNKGRWDCEKGLAIVIQSKQDYDREDVALPKQ